MFVLPHPSEMGLERWTNATLTRESIPCNELHSTSWVPLLEGKPSRRSVRPGEAIPRVTHGSRLVAWPEFLYDRASEMAALARRERAMGQFWRVVW
jgi:hypothetical protein